MSAVGCTYPYGLPATHCDVSPCVARCLSSRSTLGWNVASNADCMMLKGKRLATVVFGRVVLGWVRMRKLIFWLKDSASPWVKLNTTRLLPC